MSSREVHDSLIKKPTIFFSFKLHCLQKLQRTLLAKHYTLVKAYKQYNKSLVSRQNKINLHFCSRLN